VSVFQAPHHTDCSSWQRHTEPPFRRLTQHVVGISEQFLYIRMIRKLPGQCIYTRRRMHVIPHRSHTRARQRGGPGMRQRGGGKQISSDAAPGLPATPATPHTLSKPRRMRCAAHARVTAAADGGWGARCAALATLLKVTSTTKFACGATATHLRVASTTKFACGATASRNTTVAGPSDVTRQPAKRAAPILRQNNGGKFSEIFWPWRRCSR